MYPILSSWFESQRQKNAIATYEQLSQERHDVEQVIQDACKYNEILYETKGKFIGDVNQPILSDRSYESQLNMGKSGMMGAIEIPKISVNLPIWHGTSEEVISSGAGHLQGSSLPVGGENTRAILTSHRGLPNAKLFTRLDELKTGDLFFLHVCGKTLAYQISNIEVIEPYEMDRLSILANRDMVSLVTCTPYGINTHRLVVDGDRIDYKEKTYLGIKKEMMSFRELVFFILPFLFIGIALSQNWKNKRKGKEIEIYRKKNQNDRDPRLNSIKYRKQCKSRRW